MHPAVAMTEDRGSFIIAWTGYELQGDTSSVYLQAFEYGGAAAGDETIVSASDYSYYQFPTVSVFRSTEPLNIAWQGGTTLSGVDAATNDYNVVIQSYALSTLSAVLPVELLSFSVKEEKGNAYLNWSTAWERLNEGFEILHSTNGQDWEVIGFVAGAGETEMVQYYNYTHTSLPAGTNYYQLRQLDYDGTASLSDIERVFVETQAEIKVYPNPANDYITVAMPYQQARLSIQTVDGKLAKLIDNYQAGQKLDIATLPSGIYLLTVNEGTVQQHFRLVKQ